MKFIDEARIKVQAGRGGSGARHFHREKYVPFGGPDGGNGGRGGSVILRADRNKTTLLDFQFKPTLKAEDGQPGSDHNKDGKWGKDLIVNVPVGTLVYALNEETNTALQDKPLADLSADGEEYVLAKGGRGGKGNAFFKSPTNQAPQHVQKGEAGASGVFNLSLKLVAEVGLIGQPNAGKSTLISRISAARPKIADYPFTTLTPNLGVVKMGKGQSFVVADIPGLVPGASQGRGLGIKFLKHAQRTKLLIHLIDPLQCDSEGKPLPVIDAFRQINSELEQFDSDLANKPQIVLITKVDAVDPERKLELEHVAAQFRQMGYLCILGSSVSGFGIEALKSRIWAFLKHTRLEPHSQENPKAA